MKMEKLIKRFVRCAAVVLTAAGVSRSFAVEGLPAGYTPVRCITVTTANQFVDTGVNPTTNTDIEVRFSVPHFNNLNSIYWTRVNEGSSASYAFVLPAVATTNDRVRAYRCSSGGTSMYSAILTPPASNQVLTVRTHGKVFAFDGHRYLFPAPTLGTVANSIYLLGLHDPDGSFNSGATVAGTKIYTARIWERDVLVRDFVPCRRDSDAAAGLYDIVGGKFYGNGYAGGESFGCTAYADDSATLTVRGTPNGTGVPSPAYGTGAVPHGVPVLATMDRMAVTNQSGHVRNLLGWTLTVARDFTTNVTSSTAASRTQCAFTPQAGDEIELAWRWETLPDDCDPVDYIEVATVGQYVDTLYKPTTKTDVEAMFSVPHYENLNAIYWTRKGGGAEPAFAFIYKAGATAGNDNARVYRLSDGGASTMLPALPAAGEVVTLETALGTGNGTYALAGSTYSFAASKATSLDYSIYLFALNDAGALSTGATVPGTRLFAFKILEDGVLRRNFVPCLKASVAGLYETVEDKFYANSGTGGSFNRGAVKSKTVALTVRGTSGSYATPSPAYGQHQLAVGAGVTAAIDATTATDPTTGDSRTLEGWTLKISRGTEVETVVSAEDNRTTCSFEPESGAEYELVWRWSGLPSDFTEGQYVYVTDAQQYVDTGYRPTLGTDVAATFSVPDFSGLNSIYWTRGENVGGVAGTARAYALVFPQNANTSGIRAYRFSASSGVSGVPGVTMAVDTKMTWRTTIDKYALNGREFAFAAPQVRGLDYSIYLFALNDAGVPSSGATRTGTRIYSFDVYDNDVRVRHFVPSQRKADSEAGFYETYTCSFHANAGAGGSLGFVALDDTSALLTVSGNPVNFGNPDPAYGPHKIQSAAACEATVGLTVVTNLLLGEIRELTGWELRVRNGETETVTRSTAANFNRCSFVPAAGDQITLAWQWSNAPYGDEEAPDGYAWMDRLTVTKPILEIVGSVTNWGVAFVNTKYVPDMDDQQVFVGCPTKEPQGDQCLLSAGCQDGEQTGAIRLRNENLRWVFRYGNTETDDLDWIAIGAKRAYAITDGKLYVEGNLLCDAGALTGAAGGPTVLLAGYREKDQSDLGVYRVQSVPGTVFAYRVWSRAGALKVSMRPCTRTADGVQGLYDVVRKVFCPVLRSPVQTTSCDTEAGFVPPTVAVGTKGLDVRDISPTNLRVETQPSAEQSSVGGEATYRVTGWTLTTVDADGNSTVVTNDDSNVATCAYLPRYGECLTLTWIYGDIRYSGRESTHMPMRYAHVGWLDFTAGNYILTDYVPATDKVKAEFDFQLSDTTSAQNLFCVRKLPRKESYTLFWTAAGLQADMGDDTSATLVVASPQDVRLKVCCEQNRVWIGGREGEITVGEPFVGGDYPMAFGASYNWGSEPTVYSNWGTYRFFGAKFWEKDAGGVYRLVHRYLPAWDRLTGVSGLYDTETQTFFGNGNGFHLDFGERPMGLSIFIR